jgi:hypothetical protein
MYPSPYSEGFSQIPLGLPFISIRVNTGAGHILIINSETKKL